MAACWYRKFKLCQGGEKVGQPLESCSAGAGEHFRTTLRCVGTKDALCELARPMGIVGQLFLPSHPGEKTDEHLRSCSQRGQFQAEFLMTVDKVGHDLFLNGR